MRELLSWDGVGRDKADVMMTDKGKRAECVFEVIVGGDATWLRRRGPRPAPTVRTVGRQQATSGSVFRPIRAPGAGPGGKHHVRAANC